MFAPDGSDHSAERRLALLVARIYLGLVFLLAVWPKLTREGGFGPGLVGFVRGVGLENAHGFYRPFLETTVLSNPDVFAALVVAGELLLALALLTGTATRAAGAGAMLLVVNYMWAKGAWFWTPSSNDAAFFVLALILVLGRAGRTAGVDAYLARRYPRVPLW